MDELARAGTNKMFQLAEKISLSGTAADSKSVAIPPGRYDAIIVAVDYTVTDAGIEAGEDIAGWIKKLTIGEGANTPIHVERNEIADLIRFMHMGRVVTGAMVDTLPTTATLHHAHFVFKGPFALQFMNAPELRLETNAVTAEWAGASAMTAVVTVGLIRSDDQDGLGYYYHRESRATNTRHECACGPSLVEDIALFGTTTAYLDRITMDSDQVGRKAVDFDNYTVVNAAWLDATEQASDAGAFLINNVDIRNFPGRRLVIDNSTTDTLYAFFKNVVQG